MVAAERQRRIDTNGNGHVDVARTEVIPLHEARAKAAEVSRITRLGRLPATHRHR